MFNRRGRLCLNNIKHKIIILLFLLLFTTLRSALLRMTVGEIVGELILFYLFSQFFFLHTHKAQSVTKRPILSFV